jgi:hypothetical protein
MLLAAGARCYNDGTRYARTIQRRLGRCSNTDRVRHPMEISHRMTTARFDAPASTSPARHYARPPHAQREGVAFRIVRLIWLTALLARREPVRLDDYQRRFGMSLRSFRRDIALLRNAGMYIDSTREGDYRMLCFFADLESA